MQSVAGIYLASAFGLQICYSMYSTAEKAKALQESNKNACETVEVYKNALDELQAVRKSTLKQEEKRQKLLEHIGNLGQVGTKLDDELIQMKANRKKEMVIYMTVLFLMLMCFMLDFKRKRFVRLST